MQESRVLLPDGIYIRYTCTLGFSGLELPGRILEQ